MASEKKVEILFLGKRLGKSYHGFDEDMSFRVSQNCKAVVTETTAKRLLIDFPDDFQLIVSELEPNKTDKSWIQKRR